MGKAAALFAGRAALAVTLAAGLTIVLLGTPRPASAQSWRSLTSSRQLTGEENIDVELTFGAGRLRVSPAEAGLLYRVEFNYDEERAAPIVELDDGRLALGLDLEHGGFQFGDAESENEMDVVLSREAVLDLEMEFGAVRADIELGGLSLSDLTISTGASESRITVSELNATRMERAEIEVGAASFEARGLGNLNADQIEVDAGLGEIVLDFTGDWQRNANVSVEMGLGSLTLVFPRGLGVRIEEDTFLSSFDHDGFVERGDYYYSLDWEDADRRIEVVVEAALGSVDVTWVP